MVLGDGVRRNIASVTPEERTRFISAIRQLNMRRYPGTRNDLPNPGGVSYWFSQDQIHAATHVHGNPEFLPWHRELCNRFEQLLREVDPQLSLHYWDWTQDPRAIPNANLGGGTTGTLNLFTPSLMGYGGSASAPIGEPWLSAGFYVPGAAQHRDATGNPADPPNTVVRNVSGSPATQAQDAAVVQASDYPAMRGHLESVHNAMHGFVNMGGAHISFRDPFVFLLHSNVDRLFALWQLQPGRRWRLDPNQVYGAEGTDAGINANIQPWAGGTNTRPWAPPENQITVKTCKHPSVVAPPRYDTNPGWASRGGVLTSDPVAGQNRDGRLEVFVRGTDNALWHVWQTAPNNGWSGWASRGGVLTSEPAVARNADGRLEVFVKGTDNALWHVWQLSSGGWSNWASRGGVLTSDPTVGQNADGRLEVFARGTDNALWHIWQTAPNNGWSGWASRGGILMGRPTVARNADGRLEVFVRGTDNALWHIWQTAANNGWSGWASRGGILTSEPAVGQNADGRLEVFVKGTDNALWHIWQTAPNNGWSGWTSRRGILTSEPVVASNRDGRLEVFVRGTDNALWHIWQTAPNNGWSNWASRGGILMGRPAVARNADGRLEVFVRGTDNGLWHIWQTAPNNGWSV